MTPCKSLQNTKSVVIFSFVILGIHKKGDGNSFLKGPATVTHVNS